MLACGRLITPTVPSRCVASDADRMRKAADLPQPAGVWIDEMDLGEIPRGEADLEHGKMPITIGYFEAAGFDDGGAIALAQAASFGAGEGQPQCRGIRAGSRYGRASEEAGERRVVDLAVVLAVIVLLHPGLCRLVEPCQGEVVDALQHGHQPALD